MPPQQPHLPAFLSLPAPQTSAAAFTKGLLDLEGNSLTPILVSGGQAPNGHQTSVLGRGEQAWAPDESTSPHVYVWGPAGACIGT